MGDVRLREGDGLFTEKLARGLDPFLINTRRALGVAHTTLIYRHSLAQYFCTFFIHISFDKK